MPIVKCENYIDVYRLKAQADEIGEMSGRTGRPDLTRFVCEQIVAHVDFATTDRIIDIGCGDGTLLRLVAPQVADASGVLPTDTEVARLQAELASAGIRATVCRGTAQRLPFADGSADKLVCHGVLLLLDEVDIDPALEEIARVGRHGAQVYIGEIPSRDEFADRPYGDSVIRGLAWVLVRHGVRAFLNNCRQVVVSALTDTPFVIAPKHHFHMEPEAFIARAAAHGLIATDHFPHREIDMDGNTRRSATRWDYLFRIDDAQTPRPTASMSSS